MEIQKPTVRGRSSFDTDSLPLNLLSVFLRQKKNKSKFGERNGYQQGVAKKHSSTHDKPMVNMRLERMLHLFPLRGGTRRGVSPLHFLHDRVCRLRENTETRRRGDAVGGRHPVYACNTKSDWKEAFLTF